jgi:hypothetical protein
MTSRLVISACAVISLAAGLGARSGPAWRMTAVASTWSQGQGAPEAPILSPGPAAARTPKDAEEFDHLFKTISNWGRWGQDDQLRHRQSVRAHDEQGPDDRYLPRVLSRVLTQPPRRALSHRLQRPDLEAVGEVAAEQRRWEFMLTVAPVPVIGGTGFPVNALATF